LTFHGPVDAVGACDCRTWPWVAAHLLAADGAMAWVDLVARPGWTARDIWWAVTRDPVVWSVLIPRADALVLAVGGMDALPASLPSHWREGISTIRPERLRRLVRRVYRRSHPLVVRASAGRFRALPQQATDQYLSRVVSGIRYYRPGLPVAVLTPSPWRSPDYPVRTGHAAAVAACHAWAARSGVQVVDVDALVEAMHERGGGNQDGLHWDWLTHHQVGALVAARLLP